MSYWKRTNIIGIGVESLDLLIQMKGRCFLLVEIYGWAFTDIKGNLLNRFPLSNICRK